jgi:hypothetical protein
LYKDTTRNEEDKYLKWCLDRNGLVREEKEPTDVTSSLTIRPSKSKYVDMLLWGTSSTIVGALLDISPLPGSFAEDVDDDNVPLCIQVAATLSFMGGRVEVA